jgi:cysteinyl-tRNA synthetase
VHGDEWVVPTGETISLEQIAEHGDSAGTAEPVAAVAARPTYSADTAVDDALASGDVRSALALVLSELPDDVNDVSTLRGQVARIIAAVGEPVDVTETVRPLVDLVLELRTQARAEKRWAESDTIRDGMAAAGIEVRDTPDGVEWEVRR